MYRTVLVSWLTRCASLKKTLNRHITNGTAVHISTGIIFGTIFNTDTAYFLILLQWSHVGKTRLPIYINVNFYSAL